MRKWLQQLESSTLLTTLSKNEDENHMHKETKQTSCEEILWGFDYVMRETEKLHVYCQRVLHNFWHGERCQKDYSLDPRNFVIQATICSKTMAITLVLEMSFWTFSYVGQSYRKKPQREIESP